MFHLAEALVFLRPTKKWGKQSPTCIFTKKNFAAYNLSRIFVAYFLLQFFIMSANILTTDILSLLSIGFFVRPIFSCLIFCFRIFCPRIKVNNNKITDSNITKRNYSFRHDISSKFFMNWIPRLKDVLRKKFATHIAFPKVYSSWLNS